MRAGWWYCLKGCAPCVTPLSFLLIFGTIPFILKRPVVGTLTYAVVGLMNPHRLSYGAAYDFPFALVLCVITLISLLISKEQKKIPMTGAVVACSLFIAWTSFTALFAQEPTLAWLEWQRVMKTMLMVVLTILTVRTVKRSEGAGAWSSRCRSASGVSRAASLPVLSGRDQPRAGTSRQLYHR